MSADNNVQEITIEDVARAASVSVSTVSRILNNKPDVASRTRTRVLQVIQALGYTPHAQAQRLAAGRSRTIALLFPVEPASYTLLDLDFITGAAQAVAEHEFFFHLVTTPVTAQSLPALYRSAQVDGLILMQIYLHDERVEFLRNQGYPFVMIGRTAENQGLSFVDLDFDHAMLLAFAHLVGLGHRTIGYLGRPAAMRQAGLGPAVRFWEGYQRALAHYQLAAIHAEVELTIKAMMIATQQLLATYPNLTAIVTPNGANTSGVIRAVQAGGRRVPDDVAVVTVATEQIAELITPRLTAITFPTATLGYRAAQMLIHKLQGKLHEPEQVLLAPQLTIRESTAVPVMRDT